MEEKEDAPIPNENKQTTTELETQEQEMQEPFEITATAQEKMDHGAPESAGNKRQHNSDTLDLDKDNGEIIVEN